MTTKMRMFLRLLPLVAGLALLAAQGPCAEKPVVRPIADKLCEGGPILPADFGDRPDAAELARQANEDCAARKAAK